MVNFSEIDKFAIKSYCAIHNVKEDKNLGDISKIDPNTIEDFDMMTWGFPCFIEGSLVLTDNGYKAIENIQVGDYVLTHKNNYKKVTKTFVNETDEILKIETMPSEAIYVTKNHPFYVRERKRKWDKYKNGYERVFNDPCWVKAENLSRMYYVGTAINQKSELPNWNGYIDRQRHSETHRNELTELFEFDDFWYIIGRYIGDGWQRSDEKSIVICGNRNEIMQIAHKCDNINLSYCISEETTVDKLIISKKELYLYVSQFGKGAANKHLTKDIFNLPIPKLQSFINGYIDADGYADSNGMFKISSVSRELIYDIAQCIAKAFKRPYSVYFTSRPKTCEIEGRIVNQRDSYTVVFKQDTRIQDKAFNENEYNWSPINNITQQEYNGLVYNIEVEDDNSYVVQGLIVHNCTDLSRAGKQQGFLDNNGNLTRSGLYYEGIRILRAKKPKISIIENVKNLVSKRFYKEFQMILNDLEEAGYNSYWKVLNAKDYGVPQNRERVFIVSIRKDIDNGKFQFPQPRENHIALLDIIEENVDEKYYVDTKRADDLISNVILGDNLPKEKLNDIIQLGNIAVEKGFKNPQIGRVYDSHGIAPSITTMQGGDRMPKVLIRVREGTKKGYAEATIGDSINIAYPKSENRRGRVGKQMVNTLETSPQQVVVLADKDEVYKIRRLTPKDCWRCMDFSDESFYKAQAAGISNSQLYKQAGNSIVVSCLYYILEELYKALPDQFSDLAVTSFFSGIGAYEVALDRLCEKINNGLTNE